VPLLTRVVLKTIYLCLPNLFLLIFYLGMFEVLVFSSCAAWSCAVTSSADYFSFLDTRF